MSRRSLSRMGLAEYEEISDLSKGIALSITRCLKYFTYIYTLLEKLLKLGYYTAVIFIAYYVYKMYTERPKSHKSVEDLSYPQVKKVETVKK